MSNPKQNVEMSSKLVLAGVIAPLSVPLLFFVLAVFRPANPLELVDSWGLMIFFMMSAVSYGGFLLLGLPIVLILKRIDRLTVLTLSITGAMGGAIVGYFLFTGLGNDHLPNQPASAIYESLGFNSFLGVLVAIIYGLIARIRLK